MKDLTAAMQKHAEELKTAGLLDELLHEIKDFQDGILDEPKLPRDAASMPAATVPIGPDTQRSVDHGEPINWDHQCAGDISATLDAVIEKAGNKFTYTITSNISDDAGTTQDTKKDQRKLIHTIDLKFKDTKIATIWAPKFPSTLLPTPYLLQIIPVSKDPKDSPISYTDRLGKHSDEKVQETLKTDFLNLLPKTAS